MIELKDKKDINKELTIYDLNSSNQIRFVIVDFLNKDHKDFYFDINETENVVNHLNKQFEDYKIRKEKEKERQNK